MKICFTIIVFLYVASALLGTTSAQATKCNSCDGKADECKPTEEVCGASPAASAETTPAAGAAEAPPARLVERQGAGPYKCLTVTGKSEDGKDSLVWKGCGVDCKDAARKKMPKDDSCTDCDADMCNLSVLVKPTGWFSLLIAMVCLVLKY